MKYFTVLLIAGLCLTFCSKESLQESLTGCEITEGALPCFDLKTSCRGGYSEWADTEAQDQTRCQCCPEKN